MDKPWSDVPCGEPKDELHDGPKADWLGSDWHESGRQQLQCVHVGAYEIRKGDRVRLCPKRRADVMDIALDGRLATVEAIEVDYDSHCHLAVVVDDDPGAELGFARQIGHRFFFAPDEVEPAPGQQESAVQPAQQRTEQPAAQVLIACVGNIFLGDDAFGVEVANELARDPLPARVVLADFGIRGIDLAYALLDGYDTVILVDAMPRGGKPGQLYLVEPNTQPAEPPKPLPIETHHLDPARVMRLVSDLGGSVRRLLVVGCEPTPFDEEADMQPGLSDPVRAAVPLAADWIRRLVREELTKQKEPCHEMDQECR